MLNKIPDSEWLKHKSFIRHQYIIKGKTLKDLLYEVNERGLRASKNQLEYQLKQWEFSKNIDKEAWTIIDCVIKKRQRDGKETDIIHCGKRLRHETVRRNTDRYRFNWTAARPNPPSIPTSPINSQIAICTPPLLKMEFDWPATLPWLLFQSKHYDSIVKVGQIYDDNTRLSLPSEIRYLDLTPKDDFAMYEFVSVRNVSKLNTLATKIAKWMPESYIGQSLQRAHIILGSLNRNESCGEIVREYWDLAIFYISNNLIGHSYNFEQIATLLKSCGAFKIKQNLWKSDNLTIRSFMENLFNISLIESTGGSSWYTENQGDTGRVVLEWLLDCKYPPDSSIIYTDDKRADGAISLLSTPLQVAISRQDFKTANCLLKAGANPNLTPPNRVNPPPLVMAIGKEERGSIRGMKSDSKPCNTALRMVKLLLRYEASTGRDEALQLAIELGYTKVVEAIIQDNAGLAGIVRLSGGRVSANGRVYPKVDKYHETNIYPPNPVYAQTALSVAASKGLLETQMILDLMALQYSETFMRNMITVDSFVAAAYASNPQVISLLYGAYMATTPPSV